jgi:hypothetical protein
MIFFSSFRLYRPSFSVCRYTYSDDVLCTIFADSQRYQHVGCNFFFLDSVSWSIYLGFQFFVWNKYPLARGLKILVFLPIFVLYYTKKEWKFQIQQTVHPTILFDSITWLLRDVWNLFSVPKGLWILCGFLH